MSSFVISASALSEIRRMIGESGYCEPVLGLREVADVSHLFEHMRGDAFNGSRDQSEVAESVTRRLDHAFANGLRPHLEVHFFERGQFLETDLLDSQGVTFVMPKGLRTLLDGCTLDLLHEGFALVDRKGSTCTLQSLAFSRRA